MTDPRSNMLDVASAGWLGVLCLVAGSLLGCIDGQAREAERFAKLSLSPCPLFLNDILSTEGLPSCPFPEGMEGPYPCAIEHFIEGDPSPRARRLLHFDRQGRLDAFSDDQDGTVVESRKLFFEASDGLRSTHHYDHLCGEPMPTYLYSVVEQRDGQGRLTQLTSGAYKASLSYQFAPGLISDSAHVEVQSGGARRLLEVDPNGHLVASTRGGRTRTTEVDDRNGRIRKVRWYDESGQTVGEAEYAYEGPRLHEIRFEYPAFRRQTYRFRYACDRSPMCMSGQGMRRGVDLLKPTALSRDPGLTRMVARTCSDQLSHGDQLCGNVLPPGFVSARCCKTSPEALEIDIRTPMAGNAVTHLRLRLGNGEALRSAACRGEQYRRVCAFPRAQLQALPDGPLVIELCDKDGQPIDTIDGDGAILREAAR